MKLFGVEYISKDDENNKNENTIKSQLKKKYFEIIMGIINISDSCNKAILSKSSH